MDTVNDQDVPWGSAVLGGVMSSLRAVVPIVVVAFACAALAWIVTVDQQLPVSNVFGWTASAIGLAGGFTLELGGVSVSLPPTLLSIGVWLLLRTAAARVRRSAADSSVRTRTLTYAGFALLPVIGMAATALAPGILPDARGALRACLLTISACVLGLRPGFDRLGTALADRVGPTVLELLAGLGDWLRRVLIALAVVALALVAVGLAFNHEVAADVVGQYSSPVAAAVGLGVVQTLYAPTIWAGALAWASGAGVTLSTGSVASVYQPVTASRAGVPVLAAIPKEPAAWMPWLGLAIVAAVLVTVLGRGAWQRESGWGALVLRTCACYLVFTVVAVFATGGIGPGGLGEFGVSIWLFPLALSGAVAAGLGLAQLMLMASARAEANAAEDG